MGISNKKITLYLSILLISLFSLQSCQKEEIEIVFSDCQRDDFTGNWQLSLQDRILHESYLPINISLSENHKRIIYTPKGEALTLCVTNCKARYVDYGILFSNEINIEVINSNKMTVTKCNRSFLFAQTHTTYTYMR